MKGSISAVLILFLVATFTPTPSYSQHRGPGWYEGAPYGRFCPGMGWGPYGARRAIKTADEAKQAIEKYYSGSGQTIQVGKIEERRWFYEAEVLSPDNTLIDRLIIDKRSGRIRSIY